MLFGLCTRCIFSRETNISRTLSLIIFVTLILSVFGRSPYIRCFQRNIRHSIDNSQPLAELFYVRPYDCLNQCILFTNNAVKSEGLCRSVVYNYLQHSCRLYDHDGRKVPAILHPANGYDYFRRTATTQECGGPMQRFLAKKRLLPPGNLNGKYPVKSLALEQDQKSNNEKRRFGNKRPDPSANQMPEPVFPEITSDLSNMPLSNSGQSPEETEITTTIALTKFEASMEEVKSLDEALASKDKASPVDVDIFSAFSEGGSANKEVVHPSTTASTRADTATPGTTSIAATTTSSSILLSDYEPAAEEVTARTTMKTTATEKPRNRFQLKPESSGGLPRGSMQNVHSPNSASELGYEENESSATDSSPSLMLTGKSESSSSVTVMPFKQQPPSSMITDDHISSVESTTTNPEQKICSTSTAYYVVIGNEIILPISGSESDVTILHGVEQSKCAKYCSSNTGPKGESLKCSSINYFPLTQKCEIYGIMAEPHGPGNLVENDEVIYAEKFCVPAHQGVQCQEDEIFILHVQNKISSETIRSVPSNSIAACLKACLNTKKCRSSSFDSNKGECFLHKTSIADNSEKLEESDAGWVLIENGCSATKRRHPSSFKRPLQLTKLDEIKKQSTTKSISEWSDWSECRYKLGSAQRVRVRTRNCEEQCPNAGMQIKKC